MANAANPLPVWLQATSSAGGLTGFYLLGDSSVQTLDGSEPSANHTDSVLLLLDETGENTTQLAMVNPGQDTAAVVAQFRRADGTVSSSSPLSLATKAGVNGKLTEVFPNRPADTAYIRISSSTALAADSLIQNSGNASVAVLGAQRAVVRSQFLNFPQIAEGGDWSSQVTILNLSDKTLIVTFRAIRENGVLFLPPSVSRNTVQEAIAPAALFRKTTAEIFGFRPESTQSGWLQVEGNEAGLTGYVSYGTRATATRAIVAAQHVPLSRAVFPHQAESAGFFTGLAIVNATALSANVDVYSVNADGTLRGKARKVLKPGQRESKLLRQWIPAADGSAGGYVLIRSDVPIIASQLFGTATLTALANVPPQVLQNDYDPAAGTPSLKVNPPLAVLETRSTQQFQAQGAASVNWSVESIEESGSAGVVSASGLFTAPSVPPPSRTVVLQASASSTNQTAGATVDIIQRNTIVGGLSVVRAVAYLAASRRFFIAEQQGTAKSAVSGSPTKISEVNGSQTLPLITINDTIEKILPYTDSAGREFLLLAGFDSGSIFRYNPATPQAAPVAVITGLKQPTSMAFTESGDLAVAEQGADQIQIVPRAGLEGTGKRNGSQHRFISAKGPQGVAVDSCTGEIFYSDSLGNVKGELAGKTRVLASDFQNPSELLLVRRRGFRCPGGASLFIVETGADRVRLVLPDSNSPPAVFLGNLSAPSDIVFLPRGNSIADDVNQSSISISDRATVQQVQVAKLYTSQNEPEIAAFDPTTGRGALTFTISGQGTTTWRKEDNTTESITLSAELTFAGMAFADGKFFPTEDVLFYVPADASRVYGTISGTVSGVLKTKDGTLLQLGPIIFTGQRTLAAIDRTSGFAGLINFDYSKLPNLNDDGEISPLDPNPQALVIVGLSGADLKAVDAFGFCVGTPADCRGGFYVRSGGLIAPRADDLVSTQGNFIVTVK